MSNINLSVAEPIPEAPPLPQEQPVQEPPVQEPPVQEPVYEAPPKRESEMRPLSSSISQGYNYKLVEPTTNLFRSGVPTSMLKFWGLQILIGLIVYVLLIVILMYFGQNHILGNVLAILVIVMGNTYMVTKFQNLDGCYKRLG